MAKSNMTGAEFKALRERLGMTPREAARAVGVDHRAIKRWETWDNVPDKALALKDAEPLNKAAKVAKSKAEAEAPAEEVEADDGSDDDSGEPAAEIEFEEDAVTVTDEADENAAVAQIITKLKRDKTAQAIAATPSIARGIASKVAMSLGWANVTRVTTPMPNGLGATFTLVNGTALG